MKSNEKTNELHSIQTLMNTILDGSGIYEKTLTGPRILCIMQYAKTVRR